MSHTVPPTPSSGHHDHHLMLTPQSYRHTSMLASSPLAASAHHHYSQTLPATPASHARPQQQQQQQPQPQQHQQQYHHARSHSVMTPGMHPIHAITTSGAPTPSHAAAAASSGATAAASAAATATAAPAAQIVPDLVRKLAAFRRGLVQERKQRQLLELQLEECQLRNDQLVNQQREQDMQLATSLELSAQLEHALHMNSIEPAAQVQSSIHERELEGIFAKPKLEAEGEIKRLFAALSTIQQYYHALEKRALSDKVAHEASALKLGRDLRTAVDALEKANQEARKYKMLMQDHMQMLSEAREDAQQKQTEQVEHAKKMQEQIDELKDKLASKESQVEQLQAELEEQKGTIESLAKRSNQLASKVDSLELTLKRFTVTRILPGATYNVSCELSIKRVSSTGELWLSVKDTLPGMPATAAGGAMGGRDRLSPPLHGSGEMEGEYMQELSSVRCRAVDEESVRGLEAAERETEVLRSMNGAIVAGAGAGGQGGGGFANGLRISEEEKALFSPSAVAGGAGNGGAGGTGLSHTVLLGYRPRFILCFTGDNHRCMIFECEQAHFRDSVCLALQQHMKPGTMIKEHHVDELGRFFGDVQFASTNS